LSLWAKAEAEDEGIFGFGERERRWVERAESAWVIGQWLNLLGLGKKLKDYLKPWWKERQWVESEGRVSEAVAV
jgi:hypothetical protein